MVDSRKVNVRCLEDVDNVPLPVYDDLKVIHRAEWGALPRGEVGGKPEPPLTKPIPYVTVNHSDTDSCKTTKQCTKFVREMQKRDMEERGLSDIQYSYIIGGDGRIYEGRGRDVPPPENPQCPELYGKCLEFLFVGKYDEVPAPYEMANCAYDIMQIFKWDNILHKEFKIKRMLKFALHPQPDPLAYREELIRSMAKKEPKSGPGCPDCSCK